MSNETQALSEGIIVQPSISIFQGRKKLRPEDIPGAMNLPPEEVASLGSKMVIDRKEVRPFNKLKRRIERDLDLNGGRFLKGAWLISKENFQAAKEAVDTHIEDFRREAQVFVDRFEDLIEEQIQRYPEFADALRRASVPKEAVAAQLQASYVYYTIEVPQEGTEAAEAIAPAINQAKSRVFRDIAMEVDRLYEESIQGRPQVTRRAISSIGKVRERLENVAFLNSKAQVVADHIGIVLGELPKTGAITEVSDLRKVEAITLLLSNSESMEKLADSEVASGREVVLLGGLSTEGLVDQPTLIDDAKTESLDVEPDIQPHSDEPANDTTEETHADVVGFW